MASNLPIMSVRALSLMLPAAALVLAGCALDSSQESIPGLQVLGQDAVIASAPDPQVELEYHVLAGELAIQRGQRARAAEEYVAALAYSNDTQLAQRATRIALFAGEPELAYRAASSWAQADPKSLDAHKTAARLALRSGALERLAEHAEAVVNLHSNGVPDGFLDLADVLSGEPEHADAALAVMQALVARHQAHAEAHYAQGLLALRYDAFDQASEAAQKAQARRPQWDKAALLRVGILIEQGNLDRAREFVDALGGPQAQRGDYQLAFARLLLDADENEAAADAFERALEAQPGNTDARYGLGVLALTLEQWGRAERAFRTLYDNRQRRADAAYYLGNIAESRAEFSEARRWYKRVSGGSHAFEAKVRAARMLHEQKDLEAARAELARLRERNPELSERLYLAEGEILYQAERYADALAMYNQALADSPDSPDLLYGRSLIHERLGNLGQAEADLRAILEQDPDDARALNALGYMLSNHSQRYQEALGYVRKALDAEPDDPAVIDSMGWIQYRLGHLDKAKMFLQRAYAKFPDPEVAAHLGEVLWQLGEKQRAQEIWRNALQEDPDHPALQETVRRLAP